MGLLMGLSLPFFLKPSFVDIHSSSSEDSQKYCRCNPTVAYVRRREDTIFIFLIIPEMASPTALLLYCSTGYYCAHLTQTDLETRCATSSPTDNHINNWALLWVFDE